MESTIVLRLIVASNDRIIDMNVVCTRLIVRELDSRTDFPLYHVNMGRQVTGKLTPYHSAFIRSRGSRIHVI